MRSRRQSNAQIAEVARRRLELLSAELAATRPHPASPPSRPGVTGSGEPSLVGRRPAGPAADPPATPATPAAVPTVAPAAVPTAMPAVAPVRPAGRHARRPVPERARAASWLQDRLPPSLQGRVRVGPGHLTVLALMVAAAMALLAWTMVRAQDAGDLAPMHADAAPAGETAPAGSVAVPSEEDGPAGAVVPGLAAATPSASAAEVVVDVTGKVRRPGIVRLPSGSRVVDALRAAGGARRGVNLSSLNLARVLVDGEQVVVGVATPPGVAASAAPAAPGSGPAGPGALVNLNTADQAQLEELPGVGPVTAQAILQWRTEHGAFSAVEELLEVSGIGEATLAELAPYVTI